jgi:hypothetical protein
VNASKPLSDAVLDAHRALFTISDLLRRAQGRHSKPLDWVPMNAHDFMQLDEKLDADGMKREE